MVMTHLTEVTDRIDRSNAPWGGREERELDFLSKDQELIVLDNASKRDLLQFNTSIGSAIGMPIHSECVCYHSAFPELSAHENNPFHRVRARARVLALRSQCQRQSQFCNETRSESGGQRDPGVARAGWSEGAEDGYGCTEEDAERERPAFIKSGQNEEDK